jgi:hypothetical protein
VGEPEVQHERPAVGADHDVARLEVAVDDVLLVGVVDGVGDVAQRLERLAELQLQAAQGAALDVLHHDEAAAVLLGHAVDRDDVRMGQARRRERLAREAFGRPFLVGRRHGQLDRDPPAETGIPGLPHLADAPLPQPRHADEFRQATVGFRQHGHDLRRHRAVGTEKRVILAVDLGLEFPDALDADALPAEQVLDVDLPGDLVLGKEAGADGAAPEAAVLRSAQHAPQPPREIGVLSAFDHYEPPNSASHSWDRSSGLPTDSQRIDRTALRNSSRLRVR